MRVIINGIKKFPRFCGECFLMSGETCECSVPGIERTCNPYDGRYDDCPMSPLQTHGRLGDLDALAKQVEHERFHHAHTDGLAARHHVAEYGHFLKVISDTPTIIPADPAEEDEI